MKFEKITKRKFIADMVASNVIFVGGGFVSCNIQDSNFEDKIITLCKQIDIESSQKCKCVNHTNYLERIISDDESSRIYFNESGKKNFYQYYNIRIVEKLYSDYNRINYAIYLCV